MSGHNLQQIAVKALPKYTGKTFQRILQIARNSNQETKV